MRCSSGHSLPLRKGAVSEKSHGRCQSKLVERVGRQHFTTQEASPFRYFNASPEIIRLAVLMYARFWLSLRNVEDLLFERGIDICHETVRHWWNRFGAMFAVDIRWMKGFRQWRWHLDEVFVKVNGERHYCGARSIRKVKSWKAS